MIVSYPSNPTAQWVDLDFYKDVVALAKKHDLIVLSDVAYSEIYFDNNPPPSILQVDGAKDVAVEINSLSKTYAMAGWRVGMVVGNEQLCAALARVKSYLDYGAFTPIQVAAASALNGPQDCVDEIRGIYKSRRDTLVKAMGQAGWTIPAPPASMFAWAPVPERFREAGSMLFAKLLIEEAGVAVAPGVGFGEYGEGYVRVGLVENEHRIRQAARNVRKFLSNADELLARIHNPGGGNPMTGKTWRIGVAGLGTVGGGLLKFLAEQPDFAPAGGRAVVTGVSARSRSRKREFDISGLNWFDDPVALAASPDIDLFVELIGGSDGPAKAAVEAALALGKPVVTANKALIAEHGAELALIAEAKGAPLLFEAAVMGGTPAVKMLREAMVGDEVVGVAGILNGTCNYILSEMEASGRSFADVLAEAQRLGYAEADPTMDIGGYDAAHKIVILSALAFGCAPDYAGAEIEGLDQVELLDIKLARDLGYRIKLVASTERSEAGVSVRVHPALAPLDHPLAQTSGALNALFIEGRRIGRIFIQGPGAGAGPHRRRGGRRYRRCDDRRPSAGVPEAGRRPAAPEGRGRRAHRQARPICACWCATSRALSRRCPKPWPRSGCRSTASCRSRGMTPEWRAHRPDPPAGPRERPAERGATHRRLAVGARTAPHDTHRAGLRIP